jgi:hypothetical protein
MSSFRGKNKCYEDTLNLLSKMITHAAYVHGMIQLMFGLGLDPSYYDFHRGETSLIKFVRVGSLESERLEGMSDLGADLYTLYTEDFKFLTELSVPVINHVSDFSGTALHEAVKLRRVEFVKILLELGANTSLQDHNGNTPLEMVYQDDGYLHDEDRLECGELIKAHNRKLLATEGIKL